MLLFAVWWLSISLTFALDYEAIVADFESTLDECLSTIDDVWKYIGEVESVGNVRRRDEEVDGSHTIDMLAACVSFQRAVDNYRDTHSRLLLVQNFVTWQEMAYLNELLVPVSKEIGMPMYVASRDGDRASDFHDHCDGKGPTVVIIETTGHVFGGYAGISWSRVPDFYSSSTSFLFQLRPSFGQYKIKEKEVNAIYHQDIYGPVFGSGFDLMVYDLALNNSMSMIYPKAYDFSRGDLNGVKRYFQVKDYAVFEAIAL